MKRLLNDGYYIANHNPKAHKTEAYFDADGLLHLEVAAPPIEGESYKAIISWLSKQLKPPKQAITLLK
jgi:uncharacterized protein YggU (UPF0235/DUF167 family)